MLHAKQQTLPFSRSVKPRLEQTENEPSQHPEIHTQREALVFSYRWVKNNEPLASKIVGEDAYKELLSHLWVASDSSLQRKQCMKKKFKSWRAETPMPIFLRQKPKPINIPFDWVIYEMRQVLLRKVASILNTAGLLTHDKKLLLGCGANCLAHSALDLATLGANESHAHLLPFRSPDSQMPSQNLVAASRFLRQIALVELPEFSYSDLPYSDFEVQNLVSEQRKNIPKMHKEVPIQKSNSICKTFYATTKQAF